MTRRLIVFLTGLPLVLAAPLFAYAQQGATASAAGIPVGLVPLPVPRPQTLDTSQIDSVLAQATAKTKPTAAPDPQLTVEKINAALNAMSSLSGDFVQVTAGGRRSTGRIYVQKPGKLRFEYDPPSPLEIVADGTSVVIRDRKLNTQDLYSISQTPLKFLLRERIDVNRDTRLIDLRSEPDRAIVTIEDKSTFGGTSRITLMFDRAQTLRQWTVRDPQGYETVVTLSNIDLASRLDPALFTINYTRFSDR